MTARILVVDDVAANVKLLEARLSAEYFDVTTASNGAEALAVCGRAECDIVLLDVMMPDMDGFRGLPAAEIRSGDALHPGRDGHRARQPRRPRARPRGRRRRFPDQARLRRRAAGARALADAAEDDDRRAAHARHHLARDRHGGAGAQRRRRHRQGRPHPAGRRPPGFLRAAGADAGRRAPCRRRARSVAGAVSRRRGQLRPADRLAQPRQFRRPAACAARRARWSARGRCRSSPFPTPTTMRGCCAASRSASTTTFCVPSTRTSCWRGRAPRSGSAATPIICATTCRTRSRWRSPTR